MKRMKHSKEKMSIESRDTIITLWLFMACYIAAAIYCVERERLKEKNKETSSVNTKVVNKKENVLTYQYCKNNINIR